MGDLDTLDISEASMSGAEFWSTDFVVMLALKSGNTLKTLRTGGEFLQNDFVQSTIDKRPDSFRVQVTVTELDMSGPGQRGSNKLTVCDLPDLDSCRNFAAGVAVLSRKVQTLRLSNNQIPTKQAANFLRELKKNGGLDNVAELDLSHNMLSSETGDALSNLMNLLAQLGQEKKLKKVDLSFPRDSRTPPANKLDNAWDDFELPERGRRESTNSRTSGH